MRAWNRLHFSKQFKSPIPPLLKGDQGGFDYLPDYVVRAGNHIIVFRNKVTCLALGVITYWNLASFVTYHVF